MLQTAIIADYARRLRRHPRLKTGRAFRDWATESAALAVFLPDEPTDDAGRAAITANFADAARQHCADLVFAGDARSARRREATARDHHDIAYRLFRAALLETTGAVPPDTLCVPRRFRPARRIASWGGEG